jgi:hypothetical protein
MGHSTQTDRNQTNTVEQAILLAVKGLRYGSVEIVIHDSKVVQIERKEKMRFGGDVLKHQ